MDKLGFFNQCSILRIDSSNEIHDRLEAVRMIRTETRMSEDAIHVVLYTFRSISMK